MRGSHAYPTHRENVATFPQAGATASAYSPTKRENHTLLGAIRGRSPAAFGRAPAWDVEWLPLTSVAEVLILSLNLVNPATGKLHTPGSLYPEYEVGYARYHGGSAASPVYLYAIPHDPDSLAIFLAELQGTAVYRIAPHTHHESLTARYVVDHFWAVTFGVRLVGPMIVNPGKVVDYNPFPVIPATLEECADYGAPFDSKGMRIAEYGVRLPAPSWWRGMP